MSAADLLRVALDDAPEIEVTRADDGTATLHVLDTDGYGTPSWFALAPAEDKALRLVELLLAVAPHLVDLLDQLAHDIEHGWVAGRTADEARRVLDALAEAGAAL